MTKQEMIPHAILCAVDVNDFDQDVIDLAAVFARQAESDLNLLHVTIFADPANAAWPAYLGSPDPIIADHRKLQQIGTTVAGVNVIRHHLSGLPSQKVLDFVRRNKPRLLVLGTHARRGLSRVLGSVAAKIMRHADCPVMVLRQKNSKPLQLEKQPD